MSELTHSEVVSEVELDAIFDSDTVEVDDVFEGKEEKGEDTEEEIPSVEADEDALNDLQARLFLPKGVYTWVNPPKITAFYNEKDKKPTDVMSKVYLSTGKASDDKGRMFVAVSGVVEGRDTGKKGLFRFTYSPDVRNYGNTEDLDPASRTFANLCSFFFQQTEKKPKNIPKDLNDFLKGCTYAMYVTVSKNNDANYLGNFQRL